MHACITYYQYIVLTAHVVEWIPVIDSIDGHVLLSIVVLEYYHCIDIDTLSIDIAISIPIVLIVHIDIDNVTE